jgi:hypothetical protein
MDIKSHKETISAGAKVETGDISAQIDSKVADLAAKFLLEVQGENFQPLTPEQERKLLHKLDRWMIPMVCVERSTTLSAGLTSDASVSFSRPSALSTRWRSRRLLCTGSDPTTTSLDNSIVGLAVLSPSV